MELHNEQGNNPNLHPGPLTVDVGQHQSTGAQQSPTRDANGHDTPLEASDIESLVTLTAPSSFGTQSNKMILPKDKYDRGMSAVDTDESSTSSNSEKLRREARPWKTTLIRFGPLSGIFSMMLAMASLFASLGILIGSNNAPTKNWSVQPSAYIAICTAIANQAIRFATWHGVAIAWWTRASRKDSTLSQLHHDWRSATTIRGALTAGRHLSWLGLACICSTLVAIDGPLLQRASTVMLAPIVDDLVTLQITLSPEVPTGSTGAWSTLAGEDISPAWNQTIPTSSNRTIPNDLFLGGVQAYLSDVEVPWYNESSLTGFVSGCHGECKATVRAPALAVTSCTAHRIPVNYHEPNSVDAKAFLSGTVVLPLHSDAFLIDLSLMLGTHERVNLVTGYSQTQDCIGNFTYTACTLDSAIGEYDIQIDNGTVSLLKATDGPRIVALANNTRVNHTWDSTLSGHPSTFAGIVQTAQLAWANEIVYEVYHGNIIATGYGGENSDLFLSPDKGFNSGSCPSYLDPQRAVLESLNKLMFYTGIFAASQATANVQSNLDPGLQLHHNVTGYVQGEQNVFRSNLHWFVGAAVLEVVCIMLILPTYWGWWKLGRAVSLSPLEVAKAFEAPSLAGSSSNSTGSDIAKDFGDTPIAYGATTDNGKQKLALTDPTLVEPPSKNTTFDI